MGLGATADPLLVRQPDVVVVSAEQARAARLIQPPVSAVEMLSDSSLGRDLVTTRREYAAAGLAWYWVVAIDRPQLLVLRNAGGAFLEHAVTAGAQPLTVAEPFPVTLRPEALTV